MPTAHFSASDTGGVVELLEFLDFDENKALKKFHKLYDADAEIDQIRPDPKSWEIATSDDDRYVMLDVFVPNRVIIDVVNGVVQGVYSNLPLEVVVIERQSSGNKISFSESRPEKTILRQSEIPLDNSNIIAKHGPYSIVSTFHDYQFQTTINGIDGPISRQAPMGDGVDLFEDCDCGTIDFQLRCHELLSNKGAAKEMVEAYFDKRQKRARKKGK